MLAARSKSNVVELDDSTYGGFVTDDATRPYRLIVLLTASHPKFKCTVCHAIETNFGLIADSYRTHIKASGEEPSMFFVKIDYAKSSRTFSKYGVTTVPLMLHIDGLLGSDGDVYDVPVRDRFQGGQGDSSVGSMSSFVHTKAGVHFKVYEPMWMSYLYLLIFFSIMLLIVRKVITDLEYYISFIQLKGIWMTVSLGIYVCAISGLIFDIIRSPPMYQVDPRTRSAMFFYPHQGNQFVVEGFIIGFLNLMCGGSLYFLGVVAPTCSANSDRRTTLMAVSSVAFIVCFVAIRSLYKLKNGWYNF